MTLGIGNHIIHADKPLKSYDSYVDKKAEKFYEEISALAQKGDSKAQLFIKHSLLDKEGFMKRLKSKLNKLILENNSNTKSGKKMIMSLKLDETSRLSVKFIEFDYLYYKFLQLAKKGDRNAQLFVGYSLLSKEGLSKNIKKKLNKVMLEIVSKSKVSVPNNYMINSLKIDAPTQISIRPIELEEMLLARWFQLNGETSKSIDLYENADSEGYLLANKNLAVIKEIQNNQIGKDPFADISEETVAKLKLDSPPVHDKEIHGLRLGMHRMQILLLMKQRGIDLNPRKHINLLPYREDHFLSQDIFFKGSLDKDRVVSELEVHFINDRAHEILVWYNNLSMESAEKIMEKHTPKIAGILNEIKMTKCEPRPSIKATRVNLLVTWRYRKLEKD